jgi:hypothetical protein
VKNALIGRLIALARDYERVAHELDLLRVSLARARADRADTEERLGRLKRATQQLLERVGRSNADAEVRNAAAALDALANEDIPF